MQVEREEKEEKAGKFSTPALLQFDRKTESGVIEQKQKQYMKENKDTFTDLIKKVKEQNKNKKTKEKVETDNANDGFNLIATVENIEDVSGASDDQRGSIEDISKVGLSELVFDIPGPSKDNVGLSEPVFDIPGPSKDDVAHQTNKTVSQTTKKRSLSPAFQPTSPPKKQPRSNSKSVYVTPKKSEMEELARSPMRSQNILDRLTASGELMKKFPKIPCPVCNVGVSEKFLNIHLDKCLRSGEEPSPVFTRTKQRRKSTKPTVNKHLDRKVIEESEDSEASQVLSFSDCEDEVFANQEIPARVKLARGVVKPSIVEISDDPEWIEINSTESHNFDRVRKEEVEFNSRDDAPKDTLDDTICPPSPVYEQYTDTISQNSYVQSQVPGSDRDMFASGSDGGKDDLDSSRNLLDIEDDIEFMMEAALSEHEDDEEKSPSEKSKEQTVIKIVPTQREAQSITNDAIPETQPAELAELEAPVARSTRRTTRLRTN